MRNDRYKTTPGERKAACASEAHSSKPNASQAKQKKKHARVKALLLIIILLLIVISAVVAYSYHKAEDSLYIDFAENVSVEVGGEYIAMDYVAGYSGEITAGSATLDADEPGDKTLTFTVSKPLYGGLLIPAREETLTYSVVDTTDPIVLWSGDGTVLERGTEFDINKVIGYGDNADPKPELKIKGKVNMNENGAYPLHATVTDASGNSVKWDLTVYVADSVPVYTDSSDGTPFADFVKAHQAGVKSSNSSGESGSSGQRASAFGIDVSEWQGDIDFKAVKKAGCDFVFIRAGYSVDGEVTIDGKFEQNLKRARAAGLKVGLYLYSYDNTEDEARASAKWIIEKLGGTALELPVVFDWEDFGRFQIYEMSFADLNRMYDAFAAEITRAGYECMLYGSKNYLEKVWSDTDTRPVWLAHYTDKTDYAGPYRFWQSSSTGRISGIDGFVDMDVMY